MTLCFSVLYRTCLPSTFINLLLQYLLTKVLFWSKLKTVRGALISWDNRDSQDLHEIYGCHGCSWQWQGRARKHNLRPGGNPFIQERKAYLFPSSEIASHTKSFSEYFELGLRRILSGTSPKAISGPI